MSRTDRLARSVKHSIALRRVATAIVDPGERRRLDRVQRDLRRVIGPGVPKQRAAAALGVSVTALARWIDAGKLPTVRRPGSSRTEIEVDALLDLATEVDLIREEGLTRGVVAEAFRRLAETGRPRRRLLPNQSAQELRASFVGTTGLDRLREVADLSYATSVLTDRRPTASA